MLKAAMKACFLALQRKRREGKTFKAARRHLRKGIYYFCYAQNEIRLADGRAFAFPNLFHIHINLTGGGKHDFLGFGAGYGKTVILTENEAYGYYYTEGGYEFSKDNIKSFYDDFNYPCMSIISFDDDLRLIKTDRVSGKVFNDRSHDEEIIKGVMNALCEAKVRREKDGRVRFLQHGDANRANVLWDDKGEFKFIDLDNINFYPPLLDVFHYCGTAGYTLDETAAQLEKNAEALEKICEKAEIVAGGNCLDELFFGYASHFVKMGICYEDIAFLKDCLKSNKYPKTKELLSGKF